jgi:cation diffusion facilitator CzcD-associated flavoprotein CzcO
MRSALIGGGIGGMTFALSLLDAGIDDVDIYESTTAVKGRWRVR